MSTSRFGGFSREGVDWFRALAITQTREWFHSNRVGYDELWVEPMKALLAQIERPLGKLYKMKLKPAKIFRLNRDMRFSNDKRPYKTNISAMFGFDGSEGPMGGPVALYLHLGLDEAVAAGFYAFEPTGLLRLRKRILDEKTGPAIAKLVDAAEKKGAKLMSVSELKRAPAGVPVDHERIRLLKHKGLGLDLGPIPEKVRYAATLADWLVERAAIAVGVVNWGFEQKLHKAR